jgi:hypothetical protein
LGLIGKRFNDLSLQNFVLMMTTPEICVRKRFSVQNTACGLIILTWDSNPFLDIYCYVCMIVCRYVRMYVCMYVRMYVPMYYVYKNICIHVHKYVLYLRMYVCLCIVVLSC